MNQRNERASRDYHVYLTRRCGVSYITFVALAKSDGDLLKSAIAKRAAGLFAPVEHPIVLADAESLAIEKQAGALALMGDWQFTSLKLLKMAAGMSRSEHPVMKRQMQGFQMPGDMLCWLDGLTTCKAAELRKLVKHACAARFGFTAKSLGGGNWVYYRADGGGPFEIEIDYGGTWGQQLRYSVCLGKRHAGATPAGLRFESLLGAGHGDWDFITESTADQDVALLVELVEYVATIPTRLAEAAGSSTES